MERDDGGRSARHTEIAVDGAAETPARAAEASAKMEGHISDLAAGTAPEATRDRGGAELQFQQEGDERFATAHRSDTIVRAVGPDARQEMESGGSEGNQASFTKGINAPTADRSRYPYTAEEMDEQLTEVPRGTFPDTPGGAGATPISPDRETFLASMVERGNFPSQRDGERWALAVFNAIRQRAIEQDDALAAEFAGVVRVGEAPEVQVAEMMWGGDFVDRLSRALPSVGTWSKQEFYHMVAGEAGETIDDPWIDAAVYSFMGALKASMGAQASSMSNLGELQDVWEQA